MLSHISVLPLLLEWMQGSRSVGSMIRLAADYEGSDRRSRTCRQRKTNVQAEEAERLVVEDDRVGGGKANALAVWGASALAEEDKCALAEEDKCACCGKRVRLLWKMSVLAVEDERAGCGRSRGFRRT